MLNILLPFFLFSLLRLCAFFDFFRRAPKLLTESAKRLGSRVTLSAAADKMLGEENAFLFAWKNAPVVRAACQLRIS